MSLDLKYSVETSDGEIQVSYDSDCSPNGVSIKLVGPNDSLQLDGISLPQFERLLDLSHRLIGLSLTAEAPLSTLSLSHGDDCDCEDCDM